jgi:hypothetical protein
MFMTLPPPNKIIPEELSLLEYQWLTFDVKELFIQRQSATSKKT